MTAKSVSQPRPLLWITALYIPEISTLMPALVWVPKKTEPKIKKTLLLIFYWGDAIPGRINKWQVMKGRRTNTSGCCWAVYSFRKAVCLVPLCSESKCYGLLHRTSPGGRGEKRLFQTLPPSAQFLPQGMNSSILPGGTIQPVQQPPLGSHTPRQHNTGGVGVAPVPAVSWACGLRGGCAANLLRGLSIWEQNTHSANGRQFLN